jgi:hypothetical protein
MDIKEQMKCDHEPDPATIEYDDRHGRRAICRKCGASLVMSRYFLRAGEALDNEKKRLTSKQKREIIRKSFPAPIADMARQIQAEQESGEGSHAIVKTSGQSFSTVTRGSE